MSYEKFPPLKELQPCHNHIYIIPNVKLGNSSIQGLFSFAHCTFRGKFTSAVSIFLAKFGEWKMPLGHWQDSVIFLIFCHSKTLKRFFQNSLIHQKCQNDVCFTWQYKYGRLPCRYTMYICIAGPAILGGAGGPCPLPPHKHTHTHFFA